MKREGLRRHARGVTLIEVLVTMVIVAIGLLGLAGLQVRGLSIQKDAHGRAIATQLALDLADRMRANIDPATAPAGVPPPQYEFTTNYGGTPPASPTTDCALTACTLAQQALYDLQRWFAQVQQSLPGGWARVERVPGEPSWDVTLMWQETGFRSRGLLASSCPNNLLAGVPAAQQAGLECLVVRVRP
jgi:type IV pilus assembly protein PilV